MNHSKIQPYLMFNGRCQEAIEFYEKALDAKVEMLVRFKDSPEQGDCGDFKPDPEAVMHTSLKIGNAILMASDGRGSGELQFEGISLSFSAADEAEANKVFAALSEGGEVEMPLMKTFYSPCFGMVNDKFGVSWMVIVPGAM